MRTSPEQYGAYVGEIVTDIKNETEPYIVTEERIRKFGKGTLNCHHLWWMGRTHKDNYLRAEHVFQPQTYKPAHKELHDNCPPVPEITRPTLRVVRAEFEPTDDTLESLDNLLCLFRRLETDYRIDPADKIILPLVEHALEMQIPYLRGNIKPHNYLENLKEQERQEKIAMQNYGDYVRGYR